MFHALLLNVALVLPSASAPAEFERWPLPDRPEVVLHVARVPATTVAPAVLLVGGLSAARPLRAALAARGVALAVLEEPATGAVATAFDALTRHGGEIGVDPRRLALCGLEAGARALLHLTMESRADVCALALVSCWAAVIEGLRGDLPLLALVTARGDERVRRGLAELVHQAALNGAPASWRERADEEVVTVLADYLADRVLPAPDPAGVSDPGRATDHARVRADARDLAGTLAFLERAAALGPLDAGALALDQGFAGVRRTDGFREWLRARAPVGSVALAGPTEPGTRIHLRVRVVDGDGSTPLAGALVHLWQTDVLGRYGHDGSGDGDARLFGFVRTDDSGRFDLRTILPGGYPGTMVPRHVHATISVAGRRDRSLEVMFADDPRLDDDSRRAVQAIGFAVAEVDAHGRSLGDAVLTARG